MYEFQNSLFRNGSQVAAAIADAWFANCHESDKAAALAESTDDELAREAIQAWNLDDEWLAEREIDADDIAEAFSDLR